MKTFAFRFLTALLCLLVFASCGADSYESDEEINAKLSGAWISADDEAHAGTAVSGEAGNGVTVFEFTGERVRIHIGTPLEVESYDGGAYEISDGMISALINGEKAFASVEIDGDRMKWVTDNEVREYYRLSDENISKFPIVLEDKQHAVTD